MSNKMYQVDLTSLSIDERESMVEILENNAFNSTYFVKPFVYTLTWDSSEPIEKVTKLPKELITALN